MKKIILSKAAKIDFKFIAKYPAAIFAAGAVLMFLIGKVAEAILLVILSTVMYFAWLQKGG